MFHVPEDARIAGTVEDGCNGWFRVPSVEPGWSLQIIASDGLDWEHVSLTANDARGYRQRVPTWKEMCFAKALFWDDDDVVMQLHPKKSEYVNTHPYVLHLWRPVRATIPTPPADLVGVRPTPLAGDNPVDPPASAVPSVPNGGDSGALSFKFFE